MKLIHKIILSFIFILILTAIIFFALRAGKSKPKSNIAGKSEYNSELPLISVNFFDKEMNFMYPNIYEISGDIVNDTLSVLPEDRKMELLISDNKLTLKSISYEIRSADKSELMENKNIPLENMQEGNKLVLDIENVISKDKEYILKITLETQEKGKLYYYSRIRSYDKVANEIIDTAIDFSDRNFNYERAKENTVYLETDASFDNSNLARVTLKSNFNQLTYKNLKLTPSKVKDIRLLNYDGNMGEVLIRFRASRQNSNGNEESYEIEENFVLRRGEERLYMLSYTRNMREVFGTDRFSLTGTRLLLGITTKDSISIKQSEDKRYQAYTSLRDLFVFDNEENKLHKIFSFKTVSDEDFRNIINKHDIKILNLNDKSLDFIVYGYFNKGKYEGRSGVLLLSYDLETAILEEKAFIDSRASFGEIKQDVNKLAYFSKSGALYLKNGKKVYKLNLKDKKKEQITSLNIAEEFFVSDSGQKLAYMDKETEKVKLMNLDTDMEKEVDTYQGMLIKPIGFVHEDLVLGKADKGEEWIEHGKVIKEPFREIEIINFDLQGLSTYKNGDLYINDARIDKDRIHFTKLRKEEKNKYTFAGEDTIANSEEYSDKNGIGYYASESKTRVYYIQADREFDLEKTEFFAAEMMKSSQDTLEFSNAYIEENEKFSVYINGYLEEKTYNFAAALNLAYEGMGIVRYKGELVYARASTPGRAEIKKAEWENTDYLKERNNNTLIDLGGLSLRQVLYFIGKKEPILAYNTANKPLIIYAYDRYNISVHEIETELSYKIGLGDAGEMFEKAYNDFMIRGL